MNTEFLYFGKEVKIYSSSKIINPLNIFLDDYSIISDFCFILASKYVRIGKYSNLSPYSLITGGGEVYIGNFVEISFSVKIISGTDDIFGKSLFTPSVPTKLRNTKRLNIEIGDYVFIGANSIIYPGVKIGEGVIVNPGTIVKKNLQAWNIYDGSECKLIGKRKYKNEIISKANDLLNSGKT
ncbi:MAG: acyltransferase [Ignavibacteriae bacterium]|nr:acyltransferase [Ignavibacteriota bacterium]